MKKLFCFVLFACEVMALPCENTVDPLLIKEGFFIDSTSWVGVRAGYEGDFVSDGRLKQRHGSNCIDGFEMNNNSGILIFNIQNRLDLFGTCGVSRIKSDWRIDPTPTTFYRIEAESKYHLIWGAGGRVVLYEWGKTGLGCGGRYMQTSPRIRSISKNGTALDNSGGRFEWRAWQVDLSVSHKIDLFIPYIGIKYSRARAEAKIAEDTAIADNGSNTVRMRNKDHFGTVLGCTLTSDKIFALTAEVRLVDEEAFTISGEFRF